MFNPDSSPAPVTAKPSTAERAARAATARQNAVLDAALVGRVKAGDETAFVEIVTRYRAKLFNVAFGVLRNRADAEEIAQDALIRAHRSLVNFRGDSSLAAWLYLIALNLARNRYWYFHRRRRHATLPLDAAMSESGTATFADLVACETPGPVRETATREFAAIIDDCMDRLTVDQRAILTLRNVQHQSYGHISRMLGVRVGTVKSRIARARNQLRVLLAKACPEFAPEASPFLCFENLRPSGQLVAVYA